MKSMTHVAILIAAAAMGQIASAEGLTKFTAPFAFSTPSGTMPAGKYELEVRSIGTSNPVVLLRHESTRTRNLFVAGAGQDNGSPRVEFSCANGNDCRLYKVALRGMIYSAPGQFKRRDARLFTVNVTPGKSSAD